MDEFNKYFNEEFFVIDSDNLDLIENRLYGFYFDGEKIVKQNIIDNLRGNGTYLFVKSKSEGIQIFQDFNGNYGLYLYKNGDYFAISNSFLKLVEFLKNHHELTLNVDYANYFMSSGLNSTIYKETLVTEIEIIPRHYVVDIDRITQTLSFIEIDYEEHSIDLDSKEALEILDNWFFKWVNYIRLLKKQTNNIQFDLSGGFDSRVMLLLLLSANVDLNKIEIRSFDDGELCHSDDYLIASEIADKFNFNLNNKVINAEKIKFKDIKTPLNISFYAKLGFHNQLNYKFFKTKQPIYNFSGFGGENLREYDNLTPKEYLNKYVDIAKRTDKYLEKSTERILQTTIKNISDEYCLDANSKELCRTIFNETRSRNHYGKLSVEEFFSNKLLLMPFFDPELHKLKLSTEKCGDNNLLFALIYLRYCPELLNFKFERNRKINDETLNVARKINEISPFIAKNYSFISGPEIDENKLKEYYDVNHKSIKWESDGYYIKWVDVDNYLKEVFQSREFKKEFEKYFSIELYNKIIHKISHETYFPLQASYPAFSVLKIINDVKFSQYKNKQNLTDWFESFNKLNQESAVLITSKWINLLLNYVTLRIDMKNKSTENNTVKIVNNNDVDSTITFPDWYSDYLGKGLVLKTNKGKIKINAQCVGDGVIEIRFRGNDVRDKNGNRFPIFIDLTKVVINDEVILNENKLVWHDEPHIFRKKVANGEIITLEVEWMPFNKFSSYNL